MLGNVMNLAVGLVLRRILREEIRMRGLKAVRAYVSGVGKVRIGTMAAIGGIAFVALVVAGFVLTISGLLALLPIGETALAWTSLIVGLILSITGITVMVLLFNQKRWLEASRSYELMEAVMEPVPSAVAVPKNLVRAMKRQPTEHVPRETVEPRRDSPLDRPIKLRPQEV